MKTISFNESELSLLSDAILAYIREVRKSYDKVRDLGISSNEIEERMDKSLELLKKINSEEA